MQTTEGNSSDTAGAICLVNTDNERDSSLLNSSLIAFVGVNFLEGQVAFSHTGSSDFRKREIIRQTVPQESSRMIWRYVCNLKTRGETER